MGGHNCLYYDSLNDLCSVVANFLRDGIRKHMLCVWVIPEGLEVETAKGTLRGMLEDMDKHIETGQLEIREFRDWYIPSGAFEPEGTLNAWAQKESQAAARGFSALCAIGDGSWLWEKEKEKLLAYENSVGKVISRRRVFALCTYASERFNREEKESINRYHSTILSHLQGMLTISS